jgi:hypothetical protein
MTSRSPTPFPHWLLVLVLSIWFVAVSVPLSSWMASHTLPLPEPARPMAIDALQQAPAGWGAIHILSAQCGCSEIVAEYLVARRAQPGLHEEVWVVDGPAPWEPALKQAGFAVAGRSAEQLAAIAGIQGAPWLIIQRGGQVAYSGGYSERAPRPGGTFEDIATWRALQAGEAVAARPSYGCATSRFLKTALDPFALKYSR